MERMKGRYHSTDAWRGYRIPATAVAGTSYTGEAEDSPCPKASVYPELQRLRTFLKGRGIQSRLRQSSSSNLFMVKVWVCVSPKDFSRAFKLANGWLKAHDNDTQFIHDAT